MHLDDRNSATINPATAPASRRANVAALVLLVLACLHCSRAIFFDNVSWVDLRQYGLGFERSPFQQRVAMMPIVRLAGASPLMQRLAAVLDRSDRHQLGRRCPECAEPMSAEKLAMLAIGTACNLISVFALWCYGRRYGVLRWLPPAVFLVILYVSYAARYEEAYWYPYDLPHALLFGLACLAILEGPLWMLFPLFLLDIPMRETSVFLVLVSFPELLIRLGWKKALGTSLAMVLAWVAIRVPIAHHFAHNPTETGPRLVLNLRNLALPLHWPQIASALGFLLLPIWFGRSVLSSDHRRFLRFMLPCLAFTAIFGIWIESRIAIEWTVPIAWLASIECMELFRGQFSTSLRST